MPGIIKRSFLRFAPLCLIMAMIILCGSTSAFASIYYVKPSGSDSNTGLSEAQAWKTITYAMSNSIAGDTVRVMAGTYNTAAGETLPINLGSGKYLIKWGSGMATIEETLGINQNTIAIISDSTLEGLNIKNSDSYYQCVNVTGNNNLIKNCTIEVSYYGIGVYGEYCGYNYIYGCTFKGDNAGYGIYGLSLTNSTFESNVIEGVFNYGGVYLYYYCSNDYVLNNRIVNNSSVSYPYGVYIYYRCDNILVKNNYIDVSQANTGAGVYSIAYASSGYNGNITVANNILLGGGASGGSGYGVMLYGSGNVTSNEVRNFMAGIYIMYRNNTINLDGNTLIKCYYGVFHSVTGAVAVKNSVMSSGPESAGESGGLSGSYGIYSSYSSYVTSTYNNIYGNTTSYGGGTILDKTGDIHTNAKFISIGANNYHLNPDSPCVDTGTPAGTDMGCYQFVGPSLISPNGGETWEAGSIHQVTWNAPDASLINLFYTIGGTYTPIATSEINDGSYSWAIPDILTTEAKVRMQASYPSGGMVTKESASKFSIVTTYDYPSVEVVAPNGGEKWSGGATHEVKWTATDSGGISEIRIFYTTGEGWSQIASGETNDGSYIWTLPSFNTVEAKVRIQAFDQATARNMSSKESAAKFTIDITPPSIPTPETPANGSTTNEARPTIGWDASTDNLSGIAGYQLIINSTSYLLGSVTSYTPPANLADGWYTWEVRAVDGAGIWGSPSPGWSFNLNDTTPPLVTVEAPNGGEYIKGGGNYDIRWTATDESGVNEIRIYYSTGEGWVQIASGEANDGIYNWTLPLFNTAEARVKIEAIDGSHNHNISSDISNGYFVIDMTPPSVPNLVTPPNGQIRANAFPDLTWEASTDNLSGVVSYEIVLDGTVLATQGAVTAISVTNPSAGTHTWTVKAKDGAGNWGNYATSFTYTVTTDVYVDAAGGLNANNGLTPASAWQTLTYAFTQVGAGQRVNVLAGTYDSALGETFPLTIPDTVEVKGYGPGSKILDATGYGADTVALNTGSKIGGVKIIVDQWCYGIEMYYDRSTVEDCTIEAGDQTEGIDTSANYLTIRRTTITCPSGTGYDAIYCWGSYITIEGCVINGSRNKSIYVTGGNNSYNIIGNILTNEASGNRVLYVGGGSDHVIKDNVIKATGLGDGFYGSSNDFVNLYFNNNVIVGGSVYGSGSGIYYAGYGEISSNEIRGFERGIYVDEVYTNDSLLNNNTIVRCKKGVYNNAFNPLNLNILNTIISSTPEAGGTPLAGSVGIHHSGNGAVTNSNFNCIYGNLITYEGTINGKIGDIYGNAMFENVANDNYHLLDGSPCIDVGTPEGVDIGRFQAGPFTVTVNLISPNGGETWEAGSIHPIAWSATGSPNIIRLYFKSGGSAYQFITSEANSGSYSWSVPVILTNEAMVSVEAYKTLTGELASDESAGYFTITDKTDIPTVEVTSPGAVIWQGGATYEVTWNASDESGISEVRLYYTTGESWVPIVSGLSNTGSYFWQLPRFNTAEAKVRAIVLDGSYYKNAGTGESVFFTIDSQGPYAPTLEAPTNGTVTTESRVHFSWFPATDDFSGVAIYSIAIDNNPAVLGNVISYEVNLVDGKHTWEVAARDGVGNWGAWSTSWEVTYNDAKAPLVTLEAPNGGESWIANTTHGIVFSATDESGFKLNSLNIWYSTDNGSTYSNLITQDAAVVSPYNWLIPDIYTTEVKVKISLKDNSVLQNIATDESNSKFSIIYAAPTVGSIIPNSGYTTQTIEGVSISGSGFRAGASVKLARSGLADIPATNVSVIGDSSITCTLDLYGKAPGIYNVVATNLGGQTGNLPYGFNLSYPPPGVASAEPNRGSLFGGTNVKVYGSNFYKSYYLRAVTITNSGSPLTDYQVPIKLDTAQLIVDGKMSIDGRDIRVTDTDEATQLSYWVEGINTSTTVVWAKVPSIPTGNKTIYLRYGDTSLSSQSNLSALFPALTNSSNKVWLNANDGTGQTISGASVSTWTDKSGNNNNAIQATSSRQPLFYNNMINGMPAVQYDGSDDVLERLGLTGVTTQVAVFVAARFYNTANRALLDFSDNLTTNRTILLGTEGGLLKWRPFNTTGAQASYSFSDTSNFNLFYAYHQAASREIFQNGTSRNSKVVASTYANPINLRVGELFQDVWPLTGNIAEVLVYNAFLSTSDRQQIEGYLNNKYRLYSTGTLPTVTLGTIETGGVLKVKFDGNYAAGISLESATTLRAVTPAHPLGTVEVTVINPDGQVATAEGAYTYVKPPIKLYAPASGEVVKRGTIANITWESNAVFSSINIYCSINNGQTYSTVATNELDDWIYPWFVSQTATTQARIKIEGVSTEGNVTDEGSTFTILPATMFYVNLATGSDSYNGVSSEVNGTTGPWKTVTMASTMSATGSNVYVAPGRYSVAYEKFPIAMTNRRFISTQTWLATIDSASNVSNTINLGANATVEGFSIKTAINGASPYRSMVYINGNNATLRNCFVTPEGASNYFYAVDAEYVTGMLLENNTISKLAEDFPVIYFLASGAMNAIIRNNTIRSYSPYSDRHPIYLNCSTSSYVTIEGNTIIGHDGINNYRAKADILNNKIIYNNAGSNNGTGLTENQSVGGSVYGNEIRGYGTGINSYNAPIIYRHNMLAKNIVGLAVGGGTATIENSIISAAPQPGSFVYGSKGIDLVGGTVFSRYNSIYNHQDNYNGTVGDKSNDLYSSPRFVNAAANDYRLFSDSPCAGTASDGLNRGCYGTIEAASGIRSVSYVSGSGNDTDTGTDEAHPWRTITHGLNSTEGTVYLGPGTYMTGESFSLNLLGNRLIKNPADGFVMIDSGTAAAHTLVLSAMTPTLEGYFLKSSNNAAESSGNGYFVLMVPIDNAVVRNNTISQECATERNAGVWVRGANCTVEGNLITAKSSNSQCMTLRIGDFSLTLADNANIRNNTISNLVGGYTVELYYANNALIDGNTIYGKYGIYLGNSCNNYLIRGNKVIAAPSNNYGVYLVGNGTALSNEVRGFDAGIMINSGGPHLINHNTIIKNKYGIYPYSSLTGSDLVTLKNNIVSAAPTLGAYYAGSYGIYRNGGNVNSSYNDIFNNDVNYYGSPTIDASDITSCPRFADVSSNDYRLFSDSPCAGSADDFGNRGCYPTLESASTIRSESYVSGGGSDTSGYGTFANPWRSITKAIAQTEGKIYAMQGSYTTPEGETFPLTLASADLAKYPLSAPVTIDCAAAPVTIINMLKPNSTLEGFTLKNLGQPASDRYMIYAAAPNLSILNNIISSDATSGQTYGIYLTDAAHQTRIEGNTMTSRNYAPLYLYTGADDAKIRNNTILNTATYGIYLYGGDARLSIEGNVITANRAIYFYNTSDNYRISRNQLIGYNTSATYGMYLSGIGTVELNEVRNIRDSYGILVYGNPVTINRNTIVKCRYGVYCSSMTGTLSNNIIAAEIGSYPTGNVTYGIYKDGGTPVSRYNDVYACDNKWYNMVSGEVDISVDAQFGSIEAGDFHLRSTSPCIDTGTPEGTDRGCYDYLFGVRVLSPNGGENWSVGSIRPITWLSSGYPTSANISYSVNGGVNYTLLSTNEADDGNYSWTIMPPLSGNAKVRVETFLGAMVATDESDSVFTISAAPAYYVDAVIGDNSYFGITSEVSGQRGPWKNLSFAATQETANSPIYAASGTYNTANGEMFPINMFGKKIVASQTLKATIDSETINTNTLISSGTIDGFAVKNAATDNYSALNLNGPLAAVRNSSIYQASAAGNSVALSIVGSADGSRVESCAITSEGHCTVSLEAGADNVWFKNNTVTNNHAGSYGIYLPGDNNITIEGQTIIGNYGVYMAGLCNNFDIRSNKIYGFDASSHAGIYINGNGNISLNEIRGYYDAAEGAINNTAGGPVTLNKNTIVKNQVGVRVNADTYFENNIIASEVGGYSSANTKGVVQVSGLASVEYTDLYANQASVEGTVYLGAGILSVDPGFTGADANNFNLLATSECVDAGHPDPIYNDPDTTRADMGAYYYDHPITITIGYPITGESLLYNFKYNVTWEVVPGVANTIDIYYSADNGATYTPLATGEADDHVYPWIVNKPATTEAKLKIVATRSNTATAESGKFSIRSVTDYYVDAINGNDNYNGLTTEVTLGFNGPFKTITRSTREVLANKVVHVAPGLYNLALGESFPIRTQTAEALTATVSGMATIESLTLSDLVSLESRVTFEGFSLISRKPSGTTPRCIYVQGSRCTIANNRILAEVSDSQKYRSAIGIYLTDFAADSLIRDNILNLYSEGVYLKNGADRTIVRNNIINNLHPGYTSDYYYAIHFEQGGGSTYCADYVTVEGNTINTEKNGLYQQSTAVSTNIRSNKFIGTSISGGCGLMLCGSGSVLFNEIRGFGVGVSDPGSWTADYLVSHNTIVKNGVGVQLYYGNLILKNNVISSAPRLGSFYDDSIGEKRASGGSGTINSSYNNLFNHETTYSEPITNKASDEYTCPRFVDPDKNDYRLFGDSPCRGTADDGGNRGAYGTIEAASGIVPGSYVSGTGNDLTGDGSFGNPWRTIAHGLMSTEGIVNVRAGHYSSPEGEVFPLTLAIGQKVLGYSHEAAVVDSSAFTTNAFNMGNYGSIEGMTVIAKISGAYSIYAMATSPGIRDNMLTGAICLTTTAPYGRIERNHIHDNGIALNASYAIVRLNTIEVGTGTGIWMYQSHNTTIESNFIIADLGIGQDANNSSLNTFICRNKIRGFSSTSNCGLFLNGTGTASYNEIADYVGWYQVGYNWFYGHAAIEMIGSTYSIDHNTVVNFDLGIKGGSNSTVTNNIFSASPKLGTFRDSSTGISQVIGSLSSAYNNLYNNNLDYLGTVGSKFLDDYQNPRLVNPGNYDLRLYNDSPCEGTGSGGTDRGCYGTIEANAPYLIDSYVSNAGNDATGDGSLANPWKTVSRALTSTESTVYVRGGNYTQSEGEIFPYYLSMWQRVKGYQSETARIYSPTSFSNQMIFMGNNTTLESLTLENCEYVLVRIIGPDVQILNSSISKYGPATNGGTVQIMTDGDRVLIQGNNMYPVYSEGSDNLIIRNNTITNTSNDLYAIYGGIYFGGYSISPTIEGNTIISNWGIYQWSTCPNSDIRRNKIMPYGSNHRDGMYLQGTGTVSYNEVRDYQNSDITYAGIHCAAGGPFTINKNTLDYNRFGIRTDVNALVQNNIIYGYTTSSGNGIYRSAGTTTTKYNDIYYHLNNWSGVASGEGDISANPMFINRGANDFYLQLGSPCIDTGTPEGTEMGAYDYTGELSVTVRTPNGGEIWSGGSTRNITWESVGSPVSYNLYYRLSVGGGETTIATGVNGASTSYPWVVPGTPATDARVRIQAVRNSISTSDSSDAGFTIVFDNVPPLVTVEAPNGGEQWRGGATYEVTYTATDENGINEVRIYYTSGEGWVTVEAGLSNTGHYSWMTPPINTAEAKVKVLAIDGSVNQNIGSDESNGYFAIDSTPPSVPTLEAPPNSSSTSDALPTFIWQQSTDNLTGVPTYEIIIDTGIATLGAVTSFEPYVPLVDGWHTWEVEAKDGAGNISGWSAPWTVGVFVTDPLTVTVKTPDGGETWIAGSTYDITWESTGYPISIDLYYTTSEAIGYKPIAAGLSGALNSYPWYVPNELTTEAKVRVVGTRGAVIATDESSAKFTIAMPNDYYVDIVNGSNSYDGLTSEVSGTHGPWKHMTYASTHASLGSNVHVAPGYYNGFEGETFPIRINRRRFVSSSQFLATVESIAAGFDIVSLESFATIEGFTLKADYDNNPVVDLYGNNVRVLNNRIAKNGAGQAVYFRDSATDALVENNIITNVNGKAVYLLFSVVRPVIRNNTITHTGSDWGIYFEYGGFVYEDSPTIEANIINSKNGISLHENVSNFKIRNNTIIAYLPNGTGMSLAGYGSAVSNEVRGFIAGISAGVNDSHAGPILILNNTVVKNKTGISASGTWGGLITIKNNIVSGAPALGSFYDDSIGIYGSLIGPQPTIESFYNDIYNNEKNYYDYAGTMSKNADIFACPKFVDPARNDYRIYNDSPCRGSGDGGGNRGAYGAIPANSGYLTDSYVSTTGNDSSGTGSLGDPWRTITRALASTESTVYVRSGNYDAVNGETMPLTLATGQRLKGYLNEMPVIDGGGLKHTLVMGNYSTVEAMAVRNNNGYYCVHMIAVGARVANNRLEVVGSSSQPIYLKYTADQCRIEGNTITGEGVGSIFLQQVSGTVIKNNYLMRSGAGIDSYFSDSNNTTIEGNVLYGDIYFYGHGSDIRNNRLIGGGSYGIYVDGQATIVSNEVRDRVSGVRTYSNGVYLIDRNTIVRCDNGVEVGSYNATNTTVRNNIIASEISGHSGTGTKGIYVISGSATSEYNDVYANDTNWSNTSSGEGDFSLDAHFVAPAVPDDFHILESSPCRGSGTPPGTNRGCYDWVPDTFAPYVSIESPNGGEKWRGGTGHNITFVASDFAGVKPNSASFYYSTGEGTVWVPIATDQPTNSAYSWTLPLISTIEVKVRVTVRDNSPQQNLGTDESNAKFMIDSTPPAISIIAPNGGETWTGGATNEIKWTASDNYNLKPNPITIEYTSNEGIDWILIASNEANDGSYNWQSPQISTDEAKVRIFAEDEVGNIGSKESAGNFNIQMGGYSSLLISRESDSAGGNIILSWTDTATPDVYVLYGVGTGFYTNEASKWSKVTNPTAAGFAAYGGYLRHLSQVRSGSPEVYYKAVKPGSPLSFLPSAEAVGKVNIAFGLYPPNLELFALPLVPQNAAVSQVIGGQFDSDNAEIWSYYNAPTSGWRNQFYNGSIWTGSIPGALIENTRGYWIKSKTASKVVTFVGRVLTTDATAAFNTETLFLYGDPFPRTVSWEASGLSGVFNAGDQVWQWDSGWKSKNYEGGNSWSGTTLPGLMFRHGYWIKKHSGAAGWTIPRPY